MRETDDGTRAKLAAQLGGHGELPLDLVNEFYLAAPAPVRREILMRNELAGDADDVASAPNAAFLVAAARDAGAHDFTERFGSAFGIAPRTGPGRSPRARCPRRTGAVRPGRPPRSRFPAAP